MIRSLGRIGRGWRADRRRRGIYDDRGGRRGGFWLSSVVPHFVFDGEAGFVGAPVSVGFKPIFEFGFVFRSGIEEGSSRGRMSPDAPAAPEGFGEEFLGAAGIAAEVHSVVGHIKLRIRRYRSQNRLPGRTCLGFG